MRTNLADGWTNINACTTCRRRLLSRAMQIHQHESLQISRWILMASRSTGSKGDLDLLMLFVRVADRGCEQIEWRWGQFAEVERKIWLKIKDLFEILGKDNILTPREGIFKMCQHKLANFAYTIFHLFWFYWMKMPCSVELIVDVFLAQN